MKLNTRSLRLNSFLIVLALGVSACGKAQHQKNEMAQLALDVVASADESSGNTQGSYASYINPQSTKHYLALWSKSRNLVNLNSLFVPNAYASQPCWSVGFVAAHPTLTRTFGDCNFGSATLTGSVILTFQESDNDFKLENPGDHVTRNPNFIITGPRGGSLSVTGEGGGQRLTLLDPNGNSSFSWATLGMRRVLKDRKGKSLVDLKTRTTEDILISGTSRSNRVMNGGNLIIQDDVNGNSANLKFNQVAWANNCNCAVSGSISGQVSGDITGEFLVQITGCGTGKVTLNGESEDVTFDRCSSF